MKLIEALQIAQAPPAEGKPFRVYLACGFMPLHLHTFLRAHLRQRLPDRPVEVECGLFGDLPANLERAIALRFDATAVTIEWTDLDPRLGFRQLGRWRPSDLPDIAGRTRARLAQILDSVRRLAAATSVAVSAPTLPLPPVSHAPRWQASAWEAGLRADVAAFVAEATATAGVRVVGAPELDERVPPAARLDVKSEVHSGHPYRVTLDDVLGDLLARLIVPPERKKGLITDLDDTLWSGLVGEAGPEGVSWDLASGTAAHGRYQQLLDALAAAGVLIAAASKNDADTVERALRRRDLLIDEQQIHPREVHWGPKSESVGRVLRAWNVGPESVVVVDDAAIELAEVQAAHPAVTCLRFPAGDEAAVQALLVELRDLFGKETLSEEDALRAESVRNAGRLEAVAAGSHEAFLGELDGVLRFEPVNGARDARPLELVNKTNQFNLNGRRYTESDWRTQLASLERFTWVASYSDRFGPLGKIALIAGRRDGEALQVDTWVMSCRAFSRRIEHHCVERLFADFGVARIEFDFVPTERNRALQEFFAELLGTAPAAPVRLEREHFRESCPPLYHRIDGVPHG